MARVLPADFADLEPFADWAIPTERARFDKRIASEMSVLQEFYDAAFPRLESAASYLEGLPMDDLSEENRRLLWLFCSLVTVAYAVEGWKQPTVPDSGASSVDAVFEPAV